MKDIDEIRANNLKLLQEEFGGATATADRLEMTLSQFQNLRDRAKDSKTGKPRGMRKETAKKIETLAGKHPGWLDLDHSGDGPGRIASIYMQLSPARRSAAEQSLLGLLALEQAEAAAIKK